VLLRLDTPAPQAYEQRRIIATRDGLTEVMAWHNVPGTRESAKPTLSAEALYGCRLTRREQPAAHRFQFIVELPQPLHLGQSHEYGLLMRLSEGQVMRPHYIFTPEYDCTRFTLRIRFGAARPRWIRRVHAETVRMFEPNQQRGDPVELDPIGEAQVEFRDLVRYLGYGLQWQP
jgi:hypothetical protein